jgi:hypothetical protein
MLRYDGEDEVDALGWLVLAALATVALIFVAALAAALWMGWI